MHAGEGLGRLIIDLDAVLGEAVPNMDSRNDIYWSLGKALHDLYPDKLKGLRDRTDMLWRLANTDGGDPRDAE